MYITPFMENNRTEKVEPKRNMFYIQSVRTSASVLVRSSRSQSIYKYYLTFASNNWDCLIPLILSSPHSGERTEEKSALFLQSAPQLREALHVARSLPRDWKAKNFGSLPLCIMEPILKLISTKHLLQSSHGKQVIVHQWHCVNLS